MRQIFLKLGFPRKKIDTILVLLAGICLLILISSGAQAQLNLPETDSTYKNMAAGEFTPGKGFQLVKTKFGSLNISVYGMVRWLNQMSPDTTWVDHLGNTKTFDGRNDIYWHRAMIWFNGFLGTPKLTYNIAVWTVMTTQQTLVYGTLMYRFNKYITAGVGMTPNVCIRSVQGSFPFFTSTDRTMAEDGIRGGFTTGVFITGEILPKLRYTAVLGNNLSILGIKSHSAFLQKYFTELDANYR
jgi:hypothetical protein